MAITAFWIVISIGLELHNSINYDPPAGKYFFYPHFGESMTSHLLITAIGPAIGGLLFGSFIIFYLREKLTSSSYLKKITIHSLLYLLALLVCIFTVGVIGALHANDNKQFSEKLYDAVFNLRVLRLVFDWYLIVLFTIFFLDVNEKYGQGVLRKTLLGKYHTPVKESRVFMFLDLKSSTTIAENIGEELYFDMLKEFYKIAAEVIVNSHGEIYQYVGDEVIVSWEEELAIDNGNCLRCFTDLSAEVEKRRQHFIKHYGTVPEFKAAIHIGSAATGEIGMVKKEIVYSGDVLNATARMVALCNEYNAALIISGELYDKVNKTPQYKFTYIDSPELRGKSEKLKLYSVQFVNTKQEHN